MQDDKSHLWEKFYRAFLEEPKLWELMQRFSFDAVKAGHQHYSARTIFERIRWHVQVETNDPDFKINNDWPPYYSRVFMWAFPQHGPSCWRGNPPQQCPWGVSKPLVNDGFFELRVIDTNFEVEKTIYDWLEKVRGGS
jgi:hypothetical protein